MRFSTKAILGTVVFVAWFIPNTARAESLHWYNDFKEASSLAQQSNKPMMLDFWADWCAPCKVMEQEVYSDSSFVEAAGHFVPVRIDFDKQAAIVRKYGVGALPTIIFTDSYGAELFRYRGFIDAKPLAALLRSLPANVTRFNELNKRLTQNKYDFAALVSMGQEFRAAELYLSSNDYYQRALRTDEAKVNPKLAETIPPKWD